MSGNKHRQAVHGLLHYSHRQHVSHQWLRHAFTAPIIRMMTIRIRSDLLAVHSRLNHRQEWDQGRNILEAVTNRYLRTQSGEMFSVRVVYMESMQKWGGNKKLSRRCYTGPKRPNESYSNLALPYSKWQYKKSTTDLAGRSARAWRILAYPIHTYTHYIHAYIRTGINETGRAVPVVN
jgi:hypothetical protein